MTLQQITAPYGFVPLSNIIVNPSWLQPRREKDRLVPPPLHDVPFQDGLCGTLEIEVEAETPIFTRGASDPSQPFRLPDGRYALPGTAIRGALRNVVEILTFGHFARVDNHRYAVRDMQNRNLYGKYMAEIVRNPKTSKQEPMPLVNAGWLRRKKDENGRWAYRIEVCDFAKIEYRPLVNLAVQRGVRNLNPGDKQSSVTKYKRWGENSLEAEVQVDWRRRKSVNGRAMLSQFGLAQPKVGAQKGTLVFTGQPAFWKSDQTGKRFGAGNAKHHDFVFLPKDQTLELLVSREAFRDFEFAHSDRGQQDNLGRSQTPNEEWGFWKARMEKGERVPVFFLTADPAGCKLKAFGLAMMFRLPYEHSIGEAIDLVAADHCDTARLDFADGMFGTVSDSKDREECWGDDEEGPQIQRERQSPLALKGRVGISHAIALEETRPTQAVNVVLGSPKAGYYPNYVEQDPNSHGAQPRRDKSNKATYLTWMDKDGKPRGWKRYRIMTQTWKPQHPTGADGRSLDISNVGTKFHPLPEGAKFRAHVDVHNLRPEELGAFLWALDFGGDEQARHALGLARPLGYGRVRIAVISSNIEDMEDQPADLAECRQRFETYMEGKVAGWKKSPQIRELLALARPVHPDQVQYQRLDPGGKNEFRVAKNAGLALPSAAGQVQKAGITPTKGAHSDTAAQGSRKATPAPKPTPSAPADTALSRAFGNVQLVVTTEEASSGRYWTGKQSGETIEVELTSLSKKGNWRCKVPGYTDTSGTITGTAPGDAAPGRRYQVIIAAGTDPANLQMKWGRQ